jgi:methanogenic corrinoid protein MtbC1
MKGQGGADELTRQALDAGISPNDVLTKGLMVGMNVVGEKFRQKLIFVPDLLVAAKAMNAAMEHLKPFFKTDQVKHKGKFIIGTVKGDLHDIGKKLVAMMLEGAGWNIIDLGTDVSTDKFVKALQDHPGAAIGLSALLTTTMLNMEDTVREIKKISPTTKIIVGGAPLTQSFADKIGADAYSPDPQGAVEYLGSAMAS